MCDTTLSEPRASVFFFSRLIILHVRRRTPCCSCDSCFLVGPSHPAHSGFPTQGTLASTRSEKEWQSPRRPGLTGQCTCRSANPVIRTAENEVCWSVSWKLHENPLTETAATRHCRRAPHTKMGARRLSVGTRSI